MQCLRCDYQVQHIDKVQRADDDKQWTCPSCGLKNWFNESDLKVEEPTHPLLNEDSKHYEMIGGVQAIEYLESMFTKEELKAWAKVTAMKYRLRIGKKDDPSKEIKKIKTFEEYYLYLEG